MRRHRTLAFALAAFAAGLVGFAPPTLHGELGDPFDSADPELESDLQVCANRGTVVLALTRSHALFLCEADRARDTFQIRIGRNGSGKTMQGDRKTPVGRYRLGRTRTSAAFVLFIPILYPTAEQLAMGFTGTAVGLHGPANDRSKLSPMERIRDWTDGCLAVDTPQEIQRIADWVRRRAPIDIVIE